MSRNGQPWDGIGRTPLSDSGERRRAEIRAELERRATDRRIGWAVLKVAGTVVVLAVAAAVVVPRVGKTAEPKIVDRSTRHRPAAPVREIERGMRVHDLGNITVVRNEPLPKERCGAPAGTVGGGVCLLSDTQLLSNLAATGESYGLVKAGGRTVVVRNAATLEH